MIVLVPTLSVVLIVSLAAVAFPDDANVACRGWYRRSRVAHIGARFIEQRDHLSASLGPVTAFALLVCVSIPPIVLICFALGMIVTHAPAWGLNVSLYEWFMREGPEAPSLLRFLRGVSWLGNWRTVLMISGLAAVVLVVVAKQWRWLAPVLVGAALVIERDVQLTIGWFVHQPHPPTTLASFPSGGVARVIAVYGFIAYLFLRLRARPRWKTTVLVWAVIAVFAFLMGFARAALLLHWPFDIPGGWLLGGLLLGMMVAATSVFQGTFFPRREPHEQVDDRGSSS